MKLVLAEPKLFKESISTISGIVNEVNLHVDKNMIEIIAMDPANVAMVTFKLLSSAFLEYNVSREENLAINLESLNQVLRRAKPADIMHIELDEQRGRLVIKLIGESSRTFHISLMDITHKEHKIPELKFPVRIEMPSHIFNDAMEDMNIITESVMFNAMQNSFVIKSEGKLNSAKIELTSDDDTTINIEKADSVTSKYSLDYLNKIAKGSKLADSVSLYFGNEYPLKAEFKAIDKMSLSIILAPRVMND